jgi:ganglioside-induced differentiation-associated protein 1
MLTLYHHGSSACAAKVRLALAEKQLKWEGHYVDILRGEQFRPEFLALNPKGVVPVLVHDGFVLTESTLICEYVEEDFPDLPLYPTSARDRARVRLWTKAVDEELHPACSALTYLASHRHTLLRNGAGTFDEFLKQGGAEGISARTLKWQWIQHGFDAPGAAEKVRLYEHYLYKMESALRDSTWLVGTQLTMADVAMAPYLNRLASLGMNRIWEKPDLPRVRDWFDRMRSRPTFKSALLDWVPPDLAQEMRENGERSWPQIERLLSGHA